MIRPSRRVLSLSLLSALVLAACATLTVAPPAVTHPNGQVLWRIISDQCLPDQRDHGQPAPCALVSAKPDEAHGYVVLKDQTGVAQHLLMPTAKITGMEDPLLLAPDATNYFAKAWDERHFVEERLGGTVDRTKLSVAVNSQYGRSQDQLHLHIDCVNTLVALTLQAARPSRSWSGAPIHLKGHNYRVRWLAADKLDKTNPFQLLAKSMRDARHDMGAWTLALVGGVGKDGQPGFYLLADHADLAHGDSGSAEDLQDHNCAAVPHGEAAKG